MNRDEEIQSVKEKEPAANLPLAALDGILNREGYHSGRLFHSKDKATYTFVNDDEVIALHFDMNRGDLFIKGHKISSLMDHAQLEEFLVRFKKALMEQHAFTGLVKAFDAAVGRLD